MRRIAIVLLLLLSTSCIATNPKTLFSKIEPLYDTVAINLTYAKDKPRDIDIIVLLNAIKRYGIAKNAIVVQKRMVAKGYVWRHGALNKYRVMSSLPRINTETNTLHLTMSYLPGLYLAEGGSIAVGLAHPGKKHIAIFYSCVDKVCIKYVMIHELMHIIGLEHCKNTRCVMYPVIRQGQRVLKTECMNELGKILAREPDKPVQKGKGCSGVRVRENGKD